MSELTFRQKVGYFLAGAGTGLMLDIVLQIVFEAVKVWWFG